MDEIINLANKENALSLCLFKPTKFLNIYFETKKEEKPTPEEIKAYKNANANLFEHSSSCEVDFKIMPQLPYSIKMVFEDSEGKQSKMSILDWEISQLYWNLIRDNNEKKTKEKIKEKLQTFFDNHDLYLCLGTMRQMHGWTSNPFTIIGLFYPPKDVGYTPSLFQIRS